MRPNKTSLLLTPAALIMLAMPVLSHDYWFEPERLLVRVGDSVALHLFVGEALKSDEERVLQKEKTASFKMYSVGETLDLKASGTDGQIPAANVTFKSTGNYLIAMERSWSSITLDAKKFEEYLREEGLDSIIALRDQSGESEKTARERYSRYLKSLLQVGSRHDETYKRELRFKLEIVPQTNPYELKLGYPLRVKVLFEGKPLTNAKVFADNRQAGSTRTQRARTTGDGIASFKLDRSGFWLVRLVHMRRCPDPAEADWESFWAAYTFGAK